MTTVLDLPPEIAKHANTIAEYLRGQQHASESLRALETRNLSVVEWGERNFWIPSDSGRPRLIQFMPHQKIIMELFFNPKYASALNCAPNFQTLLFSTVKKSGKALALDTPLPTPTGWTTMGAVRVGDVLFDAAGKPTQVTYATEVQHNRRCYRVRFSDGTEVVADAEHIWVAEALPKYRQVTVTTEDMSADLYRKDGACNFRIRNAPYIETPAANLPISPYVLGVWLGDGNSRNGTVTCSDEDSFILDEVMREGEFLVEREPSDPFKTPQYAISSQPRGGSPYKHSQSLTVRLKKLGLLNYKHVPVQYLRASREQRIALLQGLMDTDGYISERKYGQYEISQKSARLAYDILELCNSLGLSTTYKDDASRLYGREVGRRHRIHFHAPQFDVFRLPRKLVAQKRDEVYRGHKTDRARCRRVEAITPVPSVPVRCIQVDSPSHTYLCGSGMVPTHNTALAGLVARWIAETWGSHAEVYCLASDLEQARGRIYQAALNSIELDPRYRRADKGISDVWRIIERQATYMPTHSTLRAVSSDYKGEAGSNPVATLWSELWSHSSEASRRLWDELTPVPTRPRSIRYVETYSGYEGESDLLNELEDRVTKDGRRLTYDELLSLGLVWPYPPDEPVPFFVHEPSRTFAYKDTGVQARRMPWQTPVYYTTQAAELRPQAFERLHLNHRVSSAEEFVPREWWDRLALPTNTLPALDKHTPIVVGADASVTGDCTAIVATSRDPRNRDHTVARLARIWTPQGGRPLDYTQTIEPALREWCTNYNVVEIAYDQYQLHDLMTRLRNEAVAWCRPFSQAGDRMVADKALYDAIRDQTIHHVNDPELNEHIYHVSAKVPPDDNTRLRLVKAAPKSKIDGAVALSMANYETRRLNL